MGKVRGIKICEFDTCLDLWDRSFEKTPREYFVQYFHGDPYFKPEYTRVYEEDGKLASAVCVVRREIRVGESRLVMGGISNVGTPPEHRGKGYSTECLKSSIEVMEGDGFDFSILYTGINPFYERLGWVTIPTDFTVGNFVSSFQNPKSRVQNFTVRPYDPTTDAEVVVGIYNAFSKEVLQSTVRTLDYWTGYCRIEPERMQVAQRENGKLAGYYITANYRGLSGICELACLPGEEDCLVTLLSSWAEKNLEAGKTEGGAMLPDIDTLKPVLDSVLANQRKDQIQSAMYRIINFQSIIEKLLPELSNRAAQSNVAGSVAITVEPTPSPLAGEGRGEGAFSSAVGLRVINSAVSLTAPADCDTKLHLSQEQFFRLILSIDPDTVLAASPDIIRTLFPKLPSMFWLADHF